EQGPATAATLKTGFPVTDTPAVKVAVFEAVDASDVPTAAAISTGTRWTDWPTGAADERASATTPLRKTAYPVKGSRRNSNASLSSDASAACGSKPPTMSAIENDVLSLPSNASVSHRKPSSVTLLKVGVRPVNDLSTEHDRLMPVAW